MIHIFSNCDFCIKITLIMIEKSNFNNMAMSNPFYDFSKKQKFQKSCFTGGFQQWKKDNFTFLKSLNFFFLISYPSEAYCMDF